MLQYCRRSCPNHQNDILPDISFHISQIKHYFSHPKYPSHRDQWWKIEILYQIHLRWWVEDGGSFCWKMRNQKLPSLRSCISKQKKKLKNSSGCFIPIVVKIHGAKFQVQIFINGDVDRILVKMDIGWRLLVGALTKNFDIKSYIKWIKKQSAFPSNQMM